MVMIIVVPWTTLQVHAAWDRIAWVPFVGRHVSVRDLVLNILLYVPLGYWQRSLGGRWSVWRVVGCAFALSTATELTQIFSYSRFPSAGDVTGNVIGAFLGARSAPRHIVRDQGPLDAGDRRRWPHPAIVFASGFLMTALIAQLPIKEGRDDAYMVFRYVARWLSGRGLTFNDGEFVEGFASLAWTMLLGAFSWVTGVDVVQAAVLLNYGILLVLCVVFNRTLHVAGASRAAHAVALLAFATSYAYFAVCFLGLEFALFGLLLTSFYGVTFWALRLDEEGRVSPTLFSTAGAVGGLLFATRPEAGIAFPATLLVIWIFRSRARQRGFVPAAAGYAAMTGGIVAWRYMYYGAWLPNSVRVTPLGSADLGGAIQWRLSDGAIYLLDAYQAYPMFGVIVITACALAMTRALRERSCLLVIPIVWGNVVVLLNGGEANNDARLLTMYLPVYLLAGWSVASDVYAQFGRRHALLLTAIALSLHLGVNVRAYVVAPPTARRESVLALTPDVAVDGYPRAHELVAVAMKDVWHKGDILIAESAGRIGYLAPEIYIHDPKGFTDPALVHDAAARLSLHGRMNWRYSMSLQPAVVVFHWWPHQDPWSTYGVNYPDGFERYCVRASTEGGDPYTLYVIVTNARPDYSEAIQRIGSRLLTTGTADAPRCSGLPPHAMVTGATRDRRGIRAALP
jgi:hypothetical protein